MNNRFVPFPLFDERILGILPNDPEFFKAECLNRSREIAREAPNILMSHPNGAFILWQSVYFFHLFIVDSADPLYSFESAEVIKQHEENIKRARSQDELMEKYLEDAQKLYRVIQRFLVRQRWKVVPKNVTAIIPSADDELFEKNIQTAQALLDQIDKQTEKKEIEELAEAIRSDEISVEDALKKLDSLVEVDEAKEHE